jgi:hypothetical protein
VDEYTLRDHPELGELPGFDELELKESRSDLSLLLLCLQIRIAYKATRPPIRLFVDQGLQRPQKPFGEKLFSGWTGGYLGKFESSATEPLLQIADFVAFCINRSTYLALKKPRSNVDHQFLEMVSFMQINCDKLKPWVMKRDFTTAEFDDAMRPISNPHVFAFRGHHKGHLSTTCRSRCISSHLRPDPCICPTLPSI